jgi:hypothetical protein
MKVFGLRDSESPIPQAENPPRLFYGRLSMLVVCVLSLYVAANRSTTDARH